MKEGRKCRMEGGRSGRGEKGTAGMKEGREGGREGAGGRELRHLPLNSFWSLRRKPNYGGSGRPVGR